MTAARKNLKRSHSQITANTEVKEDKKVSTYTRLIRENIQQQNKTCATPDTSVHEIININLSTLQTDGLTQPIAEDMESDPLKTLIITSLAFWTTKLKLKNKENYQIWLDLSENAPEKNAKEDIQKAICTFFKNFGDNITYLNMSNFSIFHYPYTQKDNILVQAILNLHYLDTLNLTDNIGNFPLTLYKSLTAFKNLNCLILNDTMIKPERAKAIKEKIPELSLKKLSLRDSIDTSLAAAINQSNLQYLYTPTPDKIFNAEIKKNNNLLFSENNKSFNQSKGMRNQLHLHAWQKLVVSVAFKRANERENPKDDSIISILSEILKLADESTATLRPTT